MILIYVRAYDIVCLCECGNVCKLGILRTTNGVRVVPRWTCVPRFCGHENKNNEIQTAIGSHEIPSLFCSPAAVVPNLITTITFFPCGGHDYPPSSWLSSSTVNLLPHTARWFKFQTPTIWKKLPIKRFFPHSLGITALRSSLFCSSVLLSLFFCCSPSLFCSAVLHP